MSISDAVLATLLYFRQWNAPITPADCLRFLPAPLTPPTLSQIETLLNHPPLNNVITRQQGFLVITGDEQSVWHRHACYNASLTKWRVACRSLRWIRWIPFLSMVAVTNTLPMGLATPDSDIDVLIVGRAGRLWLVRLLVSAMIQCVGKRRHGRLITNRLCLSFYLDDAHMDLRQFFDTPYDLHYAYMVGMTTTIFEAEGSAAAKQFEQANQWISDYFPQHYWSDLIGLFCVHDTPLAVQIRRGFEWVLNGQLGEGLESIVRWVQRMKIYAHHDSRIHEKEQHYVMATDGVIKFHESRAREESRKKWMEECRRYGVAISE